MEGTYHLKFGGGWGGGGPTYIYIYIFFFFGGGGVAYIKNFQFENSTMPRRLFVQTSVGACHVKELNPDNAIYHFWNSPIHLAYRYVWSQRVQFLSRFGLKIGYRC